MPAEDSCNIVVRTGISDKREPEMFYLTSLLDFPKLIEIPGGIETVIEFTEKKLVYLSYDLSTIYDLKIKRGTIIEQKTYNVKETVA